MIKKLLFSLSIFAAPFAASAQLFIDAETGAAFNTRNTVQFPNKPKSESDRIDVAKRFSTGSTLYYRLRIGYTIAERHTISALYAPLRFSYSGQFSEHQTFGGNTFAAGKAVDFIYQFNSNRLTYRFAWVNEGKFRFGIGLTAKIRDARIKVESAEALSETEDFGFVPLINFRAAYNFNEKWRVLLHGDALVGPQGRAEDIFLGGVYSPSKPHQFKLGYRILDGGADVDQVYNFALVHYIAAAYRYQFDF